MNADEHIGFGEVAPCHTETAPPATQSGPPGQKDEIPLAGGISEGKPELTNGTIIPHYENARKVVETTPGGSEDENQPEVLTALKATAAVRTQVAPRLLGVVTEAIPAELKAMKRWAPWQAVSMTKKGKYSKVPCRPDGSGLSTNAPGQWFSFNAATTALGANQMRFAGLGFVMTDVVDLTGIDLDHCVDDGHVAPWARDIVNALGSYTEFSPSRTGLRIWILGQSPDDWVNHDQGIEVYAGHGARYLTVTGHRIPGSPTALTRPDPSVLEGIAAQYRTRTSSARVVDQTMPELMHESSLPDVRSLELPSRVLEFLLNGDDGTSDRSTLVAHVTASLYSVGLSDAIVFSLLCVNDHCMTVALDHRHDDHQKALEYLWRHHCLKVRDKVARPLELPEFENVSDSDSLDAPERHGNRPLEWTAKRSESAQPERKPLPMPYPGVMADAVAAALAGAHMPQPDLTSLAILVAMAACIPGRYRLRSGGRMNLYAIGIAGTGQGKDLPRKAAVDIARIGGAKIIGKPASGPGLEDALVDQQGMLCELDEIAHLLEAVNGSKAPAYLVDLAGTLLRLFSASSGTYITRVKAAARETRPSRAIHHPCLSLIGFATPEKLGAAVSASNIEDGLLGRLLFAFGDPDVNPRRAPEFAIPASVSQAVRAIATAHAFDVVPEVASDEPSIAATSNTVLKIDPDADNLLERLMQEFHSSSRAGSSPFSQAMLARSFEKCERIAGVLAVLENPRSPTITLAHVQWAANLVRASDSAALHFMGEYMHAGKTQADAAHVLRTADRILKGEFKLPRREAEYLPRGWIARSSLLRASKLDKTFFDNAIAHLVAADEIIQDSETDVGDNGKTRTTMLFRPHRRDTT